MQKLARVMLRALDHVEPERRRAWAVSIFVWSLIGWALTHVGLIVLPPWFFKHIMVAVSWAAIVLTAGDVVSTVDVRANEDQP